MNRIAQRVESALSYKQIFQDKGVHRKFSQTDAIAHATVQLAYELSATAIITPTKSGYTTKILSKYRPQAVIVAFAPNQVIARHLALRWGVFVVPETPWLNQDEMFAYVTRVALENKFVKKGDVTVITSGLKYGAGGTSAIQLHTID
jgi:pyruvate kinase